MAFDSTDFRRCAEDQALVRITSQERLREHIGHKLGPCRFVTLTEWIKVRLGWL
jgi:hypothetical protein